MNGQVAGIRAARNAVVAAMAVATYVIFWAAYGLQSNWLITFDFWFLEPFHDVGVSRPGWVLVWDLFCTVFGPGAFRLAGVVLIVVAVVQRNIRAAVFLLLVVEVSALVTEAAKYLADRPRPETALAHALGTAFPSGHALGVMASVLALLALSGGLFGRHVRTVTIVLGAFVIVGVGVGRVVLNVHHPSDVLAGWALGYLWFLLWLAIIQPPPLRLRRTADAAISDEAMAGTQEGSDSGR